MRLALKLGAIGLVTLIGVLAEVWFFGGHDVWVFDGHDGDDPSQVSPRVTRVGVGEPLLLNGEVESTVTRVRTASRLRNAPGSTPVKPRGRFIVVNLRFTNVGRSVESARVTARLLGGNSNFTYEDLVPGGVSQRRTLVFDVPTAVTNADLELVNCLVVGKYSEYCDDGTVVLGRPQPVGGTPVIRSFIPTKRGASS
jgi:hypothetical protein